MPFTKDFIFGAATAAYQIEGAALQDGRGECIWTRYSHTAGRTHNGDTGDVACDHYHRYADDVRLMADLGLDAYRLSISWPRVLPTGTGATNAAGLDFYDKLIDTLLNANITPYITLYHWDLPQALQDRGGWGNADSVQWFADYAGLMADKLGDRVQHWITHNEPWVVAHVGHHVGRHAPGYTDPVLAYRVAHHLLLSHAAAVDVLRQRVPDAQVGITLNTAYIDPASDSDDDQQTADLSDAQLLRWFCDPLFKGHYPQVLVDFLGDTLRGVDLDAVAMAQKPLDFLGINYYYRQVVAYDACGDFYNRRYVQPQGEYTLMDWEVYPVGLERLLLRLTADYAPPAIIITENGSAFSDPLPDENGIVHDPRRVAYLHAHLGAVERALDGGAPMTGYFAWSLLDNFEWGYGYSKRFGLHYVDYTTQKRYLKQSALAYRDYIQQVKHG